MTFGNLYRFVHGWIRMRVLCLRHCESMLTTCSLQSCRWTVWLPLSGVTDKVTYNLSELVAASKQSLAVCWFEWTAQPLMGDFFSSVDTVTVLSCHSGSQWLTAVSAMTGKVSPNDCVAPWPRLWLSISDLVPTKFQHFCLRQAVLFLFASVILCCLSFHTWALAWHVTLHRE